MISHLPYVDLIFRKIQSRSVLIEQLKPDVWVQSITSGSSLIQQTLELQTNGCQIVFIDDIVNGVARVIPHNEALAEAKEWEEHKLSSDKLNGSIIRNRIIQRSRLDLP